MLAALYNAGYTNIDGANEQSTWDFRENFYLTEYSLNVDVIGYYHGYVGDYEREMTMEVFGSNSDANDVYGAIAYDYDNPDLDGYYFVLESNVVLKTYSYDTANLFY